MCVNITVMRSRCERSVVRYRSRGHRWNPALTPQSPALALSRPPARLFVFPTCTQLDLSRNFYTGASASRPRSARARRALDEPLAELHLDRRPAPRGCRRSGRRPRQREHLLEPRLDEREAVALKTIDGDRRRAQQLGVRRPATPLKSHHVSPSFVEFSRVGGGRPCRAASASASASERHSPLR